MLGTQCPSQWPSLVLLFLLAGIGAEPLEANIGEDSSHLKSSWLILIGPLERGCLSQGGIGSEGGGVVCFWEKKRKRTGFTYLGSKPGCHQCTL